MTNPITETDIYEILKGQRGVGANASYVGVHPKGPNYPPFCPIPPTNARVLEIGFGQGELIRKLLDAGLTDVFGVDAGLASHVNAFTEKDSHNPKALTPDYYNRAKLLQFDVCHTRFPWPDDWFDWVYMTETIEHLDNPYKTLMEIKRVLKHHGELAVSYPRWEETFGRDQYGPGVHAYVYPGLFSRECAARFFMQCYFQHLDYFENGASAFVRLRNWKRRPDGKRLDGYELPDIFTVVAGNYKENDLYGFVKGINSCASENPELRPS